MGQQLAGCFGVFSCFLIRRCLFLSAPGAREGPTTENRSHAERIRTPQSQRGEGGGDLWVSPNTCIRLTALVEAVALIISEDNKELWDGQSRFLHSFCLKTLFITAELLILIRWDRSRTHESARILRNKEAQKSKTHWQCCKQLSGLCLQWINQASST